MLCTAEGASEGAGVAVCCGGPAVLAAGAPYGMGALASGGNCWAVAGGGAITRTRVAGRTDAQDNATAAKTIAVPAQIARRARNGPIDNEHSGARMTGEKARAPANAAVEATVFRAESGSLYVVATPIGNLRDLTLRALDILRTVDVIAAEDTRVTSTLLARYGIDTRPRALHRHNESRQSAALIAELAAGRSVALVSDAGTPAISDPGARLVHAVASAGHRVVPIPGASAVAAAISVAGIDAERFAFIGFPPTQAKARRQLIDAFAALPVALVFYEAPHRIAGTLDELPRLLDGRRMLTIGRELTKTFETIARMPLADAAAWLRADPDRARGEFVLIVDSPIGDPTARTLPADVNRWLTALLEELPPARAAKVAAAATGVPRDALYAQALALRDRTI